jgi:6-phosphogluconolactonase
MEVVIHPDADSLALAAATLFVGEARCAVKARGRFTVALAGGSTPRRAYELLAAPPFVSLVPWVDVHVFWGDERCVDPTDPRSNERMAREALLDHVPIPPEQIHQMMCERGVVASGQPDAESAEDLARYSADRYEGLLRASFQGGGDSDAADPPTHRGRAQTGLDLVLLGLGADGHTASLFPGSDVLWQEQRWAAAVFVDADADGGVTAAGQDLWRITLTASFINRAVSVVFLVSGRQKGAIVKEVLDGPVDAVRLPAQLIHPRNGTLRWHLDDDSAPLLAGRAQERESC